ncbi:MBL fold metallo-hydrolase [Halobaculum rubrum]|uniref:MBL fold metallo-hydrolase n=1 Tax=Halobaculum rubrum TaxID=2872158 RepID=UPI001CA43389|nr:MBL fold metallo-hydrolase [Halobaculum rubrum]QZY01153.1 MBL fold metallo-hydrolase [Halobaculum rubrum]
MSTNSSGASGITESGEYPVSFGYQHANPGAGNESVLLRFGYPGGDGDACLLVDAGRNVDPSELLRPEDRLVGVCLTHAHFDHYRALSGTLDGDVPLFASPDTAAMIDDVLTVAATERGIQRSGAVEEAVVAIDGWTDVCPGVQVHPLPAGHAPGAAGFLVRFTDAEEAHDVVITGDFTLTDCAGYPGFDTGLATDIECLFLTAATDPNAGGTLTDALADTVEGALAGGRCLVTCGALTGVHVARLLAAVNSELGTDVPVRLVGQAAKLYETLGFEHDDVECVPVFDDPHSCLSPGTVTIAGPGVPNEESSGRLFRALEQDTAATVVQLVSSGGDPVTRGGCTTTGYAFSNHPTEDDLRTVVQSLEPAQTVITHQRGRTSRFNELPSCVRATGDGDSYTLYEAGTWVRPDWMTSVRKRDNAGGLRLGAFSDAFDDLPLPEIDRAAVPMLANEGVDVTVIEERIEAVDRDDTAPEQNDKRDDESTNDNPDTLPMSDAEPPSARDEHRLFETTATPEIDAEKPAEFSEELPEPTNLVTDRARRLLFDGSDSDTDEEVGADVEAPVAEGDNPGQQTTDEPAQLEEGGNDQDTLKGDDADEAVTKQSIEHEGGESVGDPTGSDSVVTIDGMTAALVRRHLADEESTKATAFVADEVEAFLASILAGDAPVESEPSVSVTVPDGLAPVLDDAVVAAGFADVDEAARDALTELLDGGETLAVPLGRLTSLVGTVAESDEYPFDTQRAVVETAVVRRLEETR